MDGYRFGVKYLNKNPLPTRIIHGLNLNLIHLSEEFPMKYKLSNKMDVIFQKKFDETQLALHHIINYEKNNSLSEAQQLIGKIFHFQKLHLWLHKIFDCDRGMDIFNNYLVTKEQIIALHDFDTLRMNWDQISTFVIDICQSAEIINNQLSISNIHSEIILIQLKNIHPFLGHTLQNLYSNLNNESFKKQISQYYLEQIIQYCNISTLQKYWTKSN